MKNTINAINGPVIKVKNTHDFFMLESVLVGPNKLMGEVIAVSNEETIIQVYESTSGLKRGDEVIGLKKLVSVTLGPGLLNNIFDGILRPLKQLSHDEGAFMSPGSGVFPLDRKRKWAVEFSVKVGSVVTPGMIYASCVETKTVKHHLLIPPDLSGEVVSVKKDGLYQVLDHVVSIKDPSGKIVDLNLTQDWPIKLERPSLVRLPMEVPLITGQRVVDTLFMIPKGGTAALPGGFGTGKTMMQHQLAKWCDADVIVYIGCGERGNEMTQVLEEFEELIDPRTNQSLMERTILIANTSNMPVASREASIYTGITIAEYYRDMGYHVALMADSTSRWAEALREISGRLEEMPAEEGFPAYLPSRISQFYERAGYFQTLSGKSGSISIIGAVSPQGADFSEPVTQNTKRFVRAFWALDKNLAYQRHYSAVNWNTSYTDYLYDLAPWYNEHLHPGFLSCRGQIMTLLSEEARLLEIVRLLGADVLPDDQKLVIQIGRVIRLGYLQQDAFHPLDTYVSLEKQLAMMEIILALYNRSKDLIKKGKALSLLLDTNLFDEIIKVKYHLKEDGLSKKNEYLNLITQTIEKIT